MYIGDFALSSTFDIKFTSRTFSTGAPGTLSSSPVISAYVDNSTTEITAGITLSVDFDSRTGLNNVRIVASGANGYAAGSNYQLVITTGTVGGVSVVGEVIGQFSIEARSALRPTTAARTLDVSAGGEAGVDWANVGSPTTSLALTGTTIAVTQKVDVDTIKTNPVVNGGTITFPSGATLASTTNITAGTIATVTNLTNAPGAGDFTATMKTSIGTAVAASAVASVTAGVTVTTNNDKTGYGLSSAAVQAVWDALTSALTTVGSVGKRVADFLTGDAYVRLGAPAGASVSADIATRLATSGYTAPTNLTAAQIATGVWTDTTAGDFTTALSIGKTIVNGVTLGTGLTINGYTGNTPQTGDSYARIGAAGVNLTSVAIAVGGLDSTGITTAAANAIADALLDRANAIETGITLRLAARYIAAANCGLASGMNTVTGTFKGIQSGAAGAGTTRLVATIDANGNRTAITTS